MYSKHRRAASDFSFFHRVNVLTDELESLRKWLKCCGAKPGKRGFDELLFCCESLCWQTPEIVIWCALPQPFINHQECTRNIDAKLRQFLLQVT